MIVSEQRKGSRKILKKENLLGIHLTVLSGVSRGYLQTPSSFRAILHNNAVVVIITIPL